MLWKKSNRILWFYGAYLTIKYVDYWNTFPAIVFNGFVRLKIYKRKGSRLHLSGALKLEQWAARKDASVLSLDYGSTIVVENEFSIGNSVFIRLSKNASLVLRGKMHESGSGVTADSTILVQNSLVVGYDCIVAWDTFVTDSDWHQFSKTGMQADTVIGDHVWIGIGSKILKGSNIGRDSVVLSNAVVGAGEYPERSLIGGVPAKVLKDNINKWIR